MGLLSFLFRKKDLESKPKSYSFSLTEIVAIGDRYDYHVEADSREEAFKKLVEWFYGEARFELNESIKQESFTITQPQKDVFYTLGMPTWFGRCISAGSSDQDWNKLRMFAKNNGIRIKN